MPISAAAFRGRLTLALEQVGFRSGARPLESGHFIMQMASSPRDELKLVRSQELDETVGFPSLNEDYTDFDAAISCTL